MPARSKYHPPNSPIHNGCKLNDPEKIPSHSYEPFHKDVLTHQVQTLPKKEYCGLAHVLKDLCRGRVKSRTKAENIEFGRMCDCNREKASSTDSALTLVHLQRRLVTSQLDDVFHTISASAHENVPSDI